MEGTTKITIDGKTFGSPEEMPPEVRAVYDQMLGRLKQLPLEPGRAVKREFSPMPGVTVEQADFEPVIRERIVCNGKEYSSLEDLPPQARAALEEARKASAAPGQSHTINVQRVNTKFTITPGGDGESPDGIVGWIVMLVAILIAIGVIAIWRFAL